MRIKHYQGFKLTAISAAMLSCFTSTTTSAQSTEALQGGIEKIEITATRRSGTVQEAPLNITALTADVLAEQNIGELEDVARWVPGLTVTDQGGRQDSPIIVRGLNTNSSGPGSDGGTVATYVGEIPLFINLRLNDIQRVEVLIGPQGTLYGAGTLGGAIRYIPKPADLEYTSGEIYGDISTLAHSNGMGGEAGVIFNLPLITDTLALRASVNYFNNPGFIDYNYLLKTPGVSLPDPDWSDNAAVSNNLKQKEDANGERTVTGKLALRWKPADWFDATLSYFYQDQHAEGRSVVQYGALDDANGLNNVIQPYESAYRFEEPRDKKDSLLSLEVKADLEFAELVSATGSSKFEAHGQRDQTDLLIRLNYSYEEFPAFSSFTREDDKVDVFTQEIRLVSKGDSALSWIVGGYYNNMDIYGLSQEFTPGYSEFVGAGRPDNLEYASKEQTEITESAIFGELGYAVTEKLDLTLGLRSYSYDVDSKTVIDLPLFYTWIGEYGPNETNLDLPAEGDKADDSGTLLKLNASYKIDDDLMVYATISEGFRIGGANGVAACPDNIDELDNQIVCALPHERVYVADTTTNYELGFKSTYLKNKVHFNAALFHVKWDDAQVSGATINGQQPITSNAEGAQSQGVEISSRAIINDSLTAYATFSHTKAKLTADAPYLFNVVDDTGTALQDFYDGKDGNRLPGSPETQFSFGMKYTQEVFGDKLLDVVYGLTSQSDVYSTVGLNADGVALPGFSLSNLSASISDEKWAVTLYVDNLFDKYAHTSVRANKSYIGDAQFPEMDHNRTDLLRAYSYYLNMPRKIGLKFTYKFED